MTSRDAYIVLNMLPGIGPVTVRNLIAELGSPEAAFQQSPNQLLRIPGVGRKTASLIVDWKDHVDLENELAITAQAGVTIVSYSEPEYPSILKEIHDPPLCLYVRGQVSALADVGDNSLAIVGSRGMTRYGREVIERLVPSLLNMGWTIVSGLARGVDTVAQQAVVNRGGCTVAVLGCGLSKVYPEENAELARAIGDKGAVISELPLLARPDRRSFPMRNRVIAGLTAGTLVVEAGERSGALITAQQANEQGRQVFAVPGPITSPQSRGCHRLIKQGAKLVETVDDIVDEFAFLPALRPMMPPAEPEKQAAKPILSADEGRLVEVLAEGVQSVEQLALASGLAMPVILSTLLTLEMKRLVKQLPGKKYCLREPGSHT